MEVDLQTSRRRTAQLAARQYGHATRRQLLDEGVPATTIDAWVRDRKLLRVHHGAYAVGYRRVEPVSRAMAAVLATGPGSVLSHDSALALWGLRRWPPQPEVIASHHVRRRASPPTARRRSPVPTRPLSSASPPPAWPAPWMT